MQEGDPSPFPQTFTEQTFTLLPGGHCLSVPRGWVAGTSCKAVKSSSLKGKPEVLTQNGSTSFLAKQSFPSIHRTKQLLHLRLDSVFPASFSRIHTDPPHFGAGIISVMLPQASFHPLLQPSQGAFFSPPCKSLIYSKPWQAAPYIVLPTITRSSLQFPVCLWWLHLPEFPCFKVPNPSNRQPASTCS